MANEDKEKRIYEMRGKVRDLYMNIGIGMGEILEVIVDDTSYFTQYEDKLYEFCLNIERDLKEWRKKNNRKSLNIYCPCWGKEISGDKAFITVAVMS